jgi:hypothetical protein
LRRETKAKDEKITYMTKLVSGPNLESVTFQIRTGSATRSAVALKNRAVISQVRMRCQLWLICSFLFNYLEDLLQKFARQKIVDFIFLFNFVRNLCHSYKYLASYTPDANRNACRSSCASNICPIITKFGMCRQKVLTLRFTGFSDFVHRPVF